MTSNKTFLAAALFAIVCVLCVTAMVAQQHPATPDLYTRSVLRLTKGTIVQTMDGAYMAEKDERWMTEAQCLQLQKENANLHFMLSQSRHLRQ